MAPEPEDLGLGVSRRQNLLFESVDIEYEELLFDPIDRLMYESALGDVG